VALDGKLFDAEGRVDVDAWEQRITGLQHVGRCRECGGALFPDPPYVDEVTGATWISCACSRCGVAYSMNAARQMARR
jgi:hypothetical protein